jgi:hypothetical protein
MANQMLDDELRAAGMAGGSLGVVEFKLKGRTALFQELALFGRGECN